MAQTFGVQSAKVLGPTKSTPSPGYVHGSVRNFSEQVTLAAQASADTIVVGLIPKGAIFLYGVLTSDTSLATATIAIGNSTTAGKYRASAVFTAVDTPTLFGVTAGEDVANTVDESVLITVATAALPASGNLKIQLFYSFN
jgi:hypothetical protein